VQVAYAIGVAKPVGVHVNTFGTGKISDEKLEAYILEHFDMRPKALIDELGLLAPIYKPTSAYGHFGRSEFSWEKTGRAAQIAADLLGGKPKGKPLAMTDGHVNGSKDKRDDGGKSKGKKTNKKKSLSAEV
jgi:S-adenosylmethionine synthetase